MMNLNNNQIILLALFVSFVTSIATGIVTVSLLEEAPPELTRTINRVVERTVERVVPEGINKTILQETTIVVSQEDIIVEVVKNAQKAAVSITALDDEEKDILARGFVISKEGVILTRAAPFLEAEGKKFSAILASGEIIPVTLKESNADTKSAIFIPVLEEGKKVEFATLTLSRGKALPGQTAILMDSQNVNVGIVSNVENSEDGNISTIKTDIDSTASKLSILVDSNGGTLGIWIEGVFFPSRTISSLLPLKKVESKKEEKIDVET